MLKSSEIAKESNLHFERSDDKGIINTAYSDLYKKSGPNLEQSQQNRRYELLQELKKKRNAIIDCKRGISDVYNGETEEENENDETMDVETRRPTFLKKKRLKHRLMLSEWFKEIPHDLEENWLLRICPVGKRNLVISNKGCTRVYSKNGEKRLEFKSLLPGGGRALTKQSEFSILDCIWEKQRNVYFILDVIAWGQVSVKNCDAEFRFFWLQSKFDENPQLQRKNECDNAASFYPLPYENVTLDSIKEKMSNPYMLLDEETDVDGLLFYHKRCPYIKGYNPLVGWLKPYMLSSELGVEVCDLYKKHEPMDYIDLENYLANKKR